MAQDNASLHTALSGMQKSEGTYTFGSLGINELKYLGIAVGSILAVAGTGGSGGGGASHSTTDSL